MADVKQALEQRAAAGRNQPVRLTRNMTIVDMVKALEPEIRRALPTVLTPERFTRMALSAINNTPELANCTPMSFIAALMNAAQLGLEPNTPLGQAYLIPYKNKGVLECQFQLGYKGLIDLAYRSGQIQVIQAQTVREFDYFEYQYGLDSKLVHRPGTGDRGEFTASSSWITEGTALRSAIRRIWMPLRPAIPSHSGAGTAHGPRIMRTWQRKR